MDPKKVSSLLMLVLVTLWGLDYSVAKTALEVFRPLNLMFFKYAGGLVVMFILKLAIDRKFTVRKQDIVMFILCALVGQVMYYFCEYSAMEYIPVSLITIILAFVPIVSILIERIAFKRKFSAKMAVWLLVCIIGIALVIGADFRILLQGKAIGYLLAFGAVMCWNAYNFLTEKISEHYTSLTMSFNQLLCTTLISLPYAIHVMPPASEFTPNLILRLAYLGMGSAGLGYLILVRGIRDLGPTISAMFTNFMPVTSTIFGWLILGEHLGWLQIVGGLIVIVASCIVISEKGKLDNARARAEADVAAGNTPVDPAKSDAADAGDAL